MRDRNEWFKEVERAYLNIELKTANRPYEIPVEVDVVEGEDVLYALGLHPRLDTPDWLVIDLDEVSELVELIRPVPVTGATSDGYHTFDELYHHRHVSSYRYQRDVLGLSTGWNVISEDAVGQTWQHPADNLYLNRPDSWEKLEEDLSNGAIGGEVLGMLPYCSYSGSEALACDKCRFGGDNRCALSVFTDIRNRIRRMRGEL